MREQSLVNEPLECSKIGENRVADFWPRTGENIFIDQGEIWHVLVYLGLYSQAMFGSEWRSSEYGSPKREKFGHKSGFSAVFTQEGRWCIPVKVNFGEEE